MQPAIGLQDIPAEIAPVVEALCRVGAELSAVIAKGALGGKLGDSVGRNTDGDDQKALDVIADEAFFAALAGKGIRWYASEEQDQVVELDPQGTLALAIDPLDGSSNIDVNVSIGTIFGIRPALPDGNETFLSDGSAMIAAGYFIYGPQTSLVVSFGDGVRKYTFDRDAACFVETERRALIPENSHEYAINASNHRHWPAPIRAYIDDCLAGTEGPRGKDFNMRWVASLVAETHRIVTRGGIFLYPSDEREEYGQGRLRLVYECVPIAFLVEQAGGKATTGTDRILNQVPKDLHARSPLGFGAAAKVERVATYHDLPEHEVSALFGNRGLFRA